jgi:hypothetical protein
VSNDSDGFVRSWSNTCNRPLAQSGWRKYLVRRNFRPIFRKGCVRGKHVCAVGIYIGAFSSDFRVI